MIFPKPVKYPGLFRYIYNQPEPCVIIATLFKIVPQRIQFKGAPNVEFSSK